MRMPIATFVGRTSIAVGLLGFVLHGGCSKNQASEGQGGGGTAVKKTVQVKGSDTLLQLSSDWAESFMKANPGLEVTVTGGGSGTGFAALANGHADIANSSRDVTAKDRELAKKTGRELVEVTVARDAIVVIVHPSNPIAEISAEQLRKVFSGQSSSWSQLGGPDRGIIVLSRDNSSGTYAYFQERILGKENYTAKAMFVQSNSAIVAQVAQDEGAIGYVGLGYYEHAKSKVKGLLVKDGDRPATSPSIETVMNGTYPISRALYIVTLGKPEGAVKAFIDFALGPEGQEAVAKSGFVPLR